MPLTPEQLQHIVDHLTEKIGTPHCPLCNASNLQIQRDLGTIPSSDMKTQVLSGPKSLKVVNAVCPFCGYVMSFSVDTIGLS
jgi:hypothetical protein